jgi:hypothetical protein
VTSTHFLGDPVTMVLADPRDGTLHAALNLGHFGIMMHRSQANFACVWLEARRKRSAAGAHCGGA